ncbi:MAG: ABC transporter ATP-binding protein, partial [Bacteroidota bacterium]
MELRIANLSKTYPNGTRALDGLDLTITTGMFGLLGPNGAGKSTLMRTIATLQQPDTGTITFGDLDVLRQPMALRLALGYLPQEFGVYPRQSADRLLDYLALLKGITDKKGRRRLIDYCLDVTNLTAHRKQHVSGYSGGMKQRFGIAQLLLNEPKLIIVDEPTAGLDPAERQRFLNILREISTESIVIFSTHIVEDVKDLCTDMAVMNHGRLLLHATPEAAAATLAGQLWTVNV